MYCTKCGTQNNDQAIQCINCGDPLRPVQQVPVKIPTYLAPAILVTIFCCVPFGIPAIVFAAQVKGKMAAGDIEGARASSRYAKIWTWVAFGVGLVAGLLYLLIVLLPLLLCGYSR